MANQQAPMTGEQTPPQRLPRNRRVSVRYKCGLATPGRIQIEGQEWRRGWVLNLSLTGVGLLLSRSLEQGTNIAVHLQDEVENKTHNVLARVCHAAREPSGEWLTGCEFLTPLTADQLDAILR